MKRITTILIFSFLSTGVWAQNFVGQGFGFRLGLTATPTIGWIKPEQGKTEGIGLGFSYGLMGDFNFAPNYSFSTALTITTINGKSTEVNVMPYHATGSTTNPVSYDLKYRMQYVELPLTIKLKTLKTDSKRWYGQFGLSNGFNISAKQDAIRNGAEVGDNVNISDYSRFYRAGLTFNNGFTNIVKDGNREVKNHYLALNFGLFF